MEKVLSLLMLAQVVAEKPAIQRASVPMDAVAVALQDVATVSGDAALYRYVWVPSGEETDCDLVDVAVNTAISTAGNPVNGIRLGGGLVMRYDLSVLCPKEADFQKLVENWERFADDEPYFLVASDGRAQVCKITRACEVVDTERTLGKVNPGDTLPLLGSYSDENEWWEVTFQGQTAYIAKENGEKQIKGRVFGLHCGREAESLVLATGSQVPLVRAEWFVRKILSTLDAGLYYEFRGIEKSPDENISDIDHLLRKFGGVKLDTFRDLGSDQKTVTVISGVTGDGRKVLYITGSQNRPTINQGLIVITQDAIDGQTADAKADPLLNLLDHKYDGIELFLELPNGFILYSLHAGDLNGDGKFDPKEGEGALVREAPPELVSDTTIPAPHGSRLQPAISCIRCHCIKRGELEPDGWIPVERDLAKLLRAGLDVFGDKTDKEAVEKLAAQYTGDFDKLFQRARDDFADAMLRLVGEPGKEFSVVTEQHSRLSKMYNSFWFDTVTASVACRELGFTVTDEKAAAAMLKRLLPPLPPTEGVSPEDARLGALKAGLGLRRIQWEAVYADAALRTVEALKQR